MVRGPNFIKLGEDIRLSSVLTKFVSDFTYLAAFSNAGRSKTSDVENEAKKALIRTAVTPTVVHFTNKICV